MHPFEEDRGKKKGKSGGSSGSKSKKVKDDHGGVPGKNQNDGTGAGPGSGQPWQSVQDATGGR